MRSKLLGFIAVLAVPVLTAQVQAADLTFKGDLLMLQGPIGPGEASRFSDALAELDLSGEPIKTVSLNSPGGLLREAIVMSDTIQAQHLNVIVPHEAQCASACFILFAAGQHKVVEQNARVGVHSATKTFGKGADDGNATMLMARYVAQLGVPAAIVGRMVVTDSTQLFWLTATDLRAMGATIRGTIREAGWNAPAWSGSARASEPMTLLGALHMAQ